MPWIVAVGDPLGVDLIGANELLKRDALVAVSKPAAEEFPDQAIGYSGVDLIMISGDGAELLGQLNQRQADAMLQWVTGGGRLLITLGSSAREFAKVAPWLFDLLPINAEAVNVRFHGS